MQISIGITFGCFIPLHTGHMDMIYKTIIRNDMAVIAVTGHDFDRGKDFIPFMRRVNLIKRIYGDNSHYDDGNGNVRIVAVDDKEIGLTGTFSQEAWKIWCTELFRNAQLDPNEPRFKYTWYIGEQDYIDKIRNLYPHHNFVKLDRSVIPVSGTQIRTDFHANEQYIHPTFYDYLVKNHG